MGDRHTCISSGMSQDHKRLDSKMICDNIVPLVESNLSIKVNDIVVYIRNKFNYTISYRKAWNAKNKAEEQIYGNWVDSYHELPLWLMVMEQWLPGTIVKLETSPTPLHGEVFFERVFWAFKPCIEGFAHCKPLVQVDGTWLTGKYKGTLLLAVAQDGNSHIFPVAFAIVEGETGDAWNFFLKNLREHVTPQEGICMISDRHPAIKSAYENPSNGWNDPPSTHAYCIRHVAQNFMRKFKDKKLQKFVVNMGYAPSEPSFQYWRHKIAEESTDALRWVDNIPKEKWTQAYDRGVRWGHMTSNLAEAMNSVFKDIRGQPITSLVKSTYYRCAELFAKRAKASAAVLASGTEYAEACQKRILDAFDKSGTHVVGRFDRETFTFSVRETEDPHEGRPRDRFKVDLPNKWCDCGKFQALYLPCSHVIAGCCDAKIPYQDHIHDIYKTATVYAVYANNFPVIQATGYWPQYVGDKVVPRSDMKRIKKGRPQKNRIRTEMDDFNKIGRCCTLCRMPDHNCSNCPYAAGPST